MKTINASIPVLRWAINRARLDESIVTRKFQKWPMWLTGKAQPTLRQLETFAQMTHTPIGYFFLPKPPVLDLPIPDFRTLRDEALNEPSSELLDTLYLCDQRQEWYREYARMHGLKPLSFVNSATMAQKPDHVASIIRKTLTLSVDERQQYHSWTEALRQMISKTEEIGILVMASSIVGSNSHRKLRVDEFRGFVQVDELAPLIFLNASDSKAAQMFTLAHELAHIWLGESGISNSITGDVPEKAIEKWCNSVAAEILVPMNNLREEYRESEGIYSEIQRLAKLFKVSTLVVLRRIFDAGFINQKTLWQAYQEELDHIRSLNSSSGGGGNFYSTLGARTGKRFARAVLSSTLEGQTLFRDAFRMLGVRKTSTFYEAAKKMEVMP